MERPVELGATAGRDSLQSGGKSFYSGDHRTVSAGSSVLERSSLFAELLNPVNVEVGYGAQD
jgi:hypothetical protein